MHRFDKSVGLVLVLLALILSLILSLRLGARPLAAAPPLVEAARAGDLAAVERLLAAGADPDQHDRHRNTALIFAARDGHLEMARALIAAGASVNWADGEKVTPLILAAHKNHPALARLLLDSGADPAPQDKWGRQALDYALRRGAGDPIARLIRASQPPAD